MFFMTKAVMRHFKNGGNIITRLFSLVLGGRIFFSFGIQKRFSLLVPQPCPFAEGGRQQRRIAKILLTAG